MADIPHILFLYGNDEYAIARRVRAIAAEFTDASMGELNVSRLDARSMTEDQWVNAINALPFLGPQRLVLLANPSARFVKRSPRSGAEADSGEAASSAASSRAESESGAEARARFFASLGGLPETTRLVLTEVVELRSNKDREQAAKHWLAVWLRKNHQGVELLAQPLMNMMPAWIMQEARAQGGQIATAAAGRLADMVGTDTRQAAQEVTKLLTYVNWGRAVTSSDVETLSPLTAAPDVFAMVDALAMGNGKQAQGLLHRLLEIQDAFSTWGMIVRQFRLLLLAREVLDRGGGEAEAVKALGTVPYVAGKALGQARSFSMAKLEQIYHRLLEIDEGAKTGRMPLEVALDLLVAELAS